MQTLKFVNELIGINAELLLPYSTKINTTNDKNAKTQHKITFNPFQFQFKPPIFNGNRIKITTAVLKIKPGKSIDFSILFG